MNPDIVGHFVDPSGRRQEGSAGECRSEGCNRDFLALGRWRRGGTAGTSGSAVGICCHLNLFFFLFGVMDENFVAGPRKHFEEMDNDGDKLTLNLTR
jgi:hypothetical protein